MKGNRLFSQYPDSFPFMPLTDFSRNPVISLRNRSRNIALPDGLFVMIDPPTNLAENTSASLRFFRDTLELRVAG